MGLNLDQSDCINSTCTTQFHPMYLHVILICATHGADDDYMLDACILGQVNLGLLSKPVNLEPQNYVVTFRHSKANSAGNRLSARSVNIRFLACLLLRSTSQVSVLQLASVSSLGQRWLHCT